MIQWLVQRGQKPSLVRPRGGRSLVADIGDPDVAAVVTVVRRRQELSVVRTGEMADLVRETCWPLDRFAHRHRQGRSWRLAS